MWKWFFVAGHNRTWSIYRKCRHPATCCFFPIWFFTVLLVWLREQVNDGRATVSSCIYSRGTTIWVQICIDNHCCTSWLLRCGEGHSSSLLLLQYYWSLFCSSNVRMFERTPSDNCVVVMCCCIWKWWFEGLHPWAQHGTDGMFDYGKILACIFWGWKVKSPPNSVVFNDTWWPGLLIWVQATL